MATSAEDELKKWADANHVAPADFVLLSGLLKRRHEEGRDESHGRFVRLMAQEVEASEGDYRDRLTHLMSYVRTCT